MADLYSSCVAHYKMNDFAASSVVIDEKGTNGTFYKLFGEEYVEVNTNATLSIPPYSILYSFAGKVGKSLKFIASDTYVNTNQKFESVFQNSFSLNFWAKPDDGMPSLANDFMGATKLTQGSFECNVGDDGKFTALYRSEGVLVSLKTDAAVFPNGATSWTMLSVVATKLSPTTMQLQLYVNGVLVKTSGVLTCSMGAFITDYNFFIGGLNGNNGRWTYYGLLDEVTIYNTAPTAGDISILHNSGRGTDNFSMYPELSSCGSRLFSQRGN